MAEWTELKALITQFDEQKTEAERKVKEADIILSYLRAALTDLKDLDSGAEPARPQPEPRPEPAAEEAPVESEEIEEPEEAAAAAGGGSSKASISALLGGGSETNWDRMD